MALKQTPTPHNDPYDDVEWVSPVAEKSSSTRQLIIDIAIKLAQQNSRSIVEENDIIAALLDSHDEEVPPIDNSTWTDEQLHTLYNTLAHIVGEYVPSLWVRFDQIREELGLYNNIRSRKIPLEASPLHVRPALQAFLADHPDYRTNVFLIIPFQETETHKKITIALRDCLAKFGFRLCRADDKSYSENLLTNIEAYICGCHFAVAVFERISYETPNPNVAFEVGYMTGLKKKICLLKEKTIKNMYSDLIGRLYVEFDSQDPYGSIPKQVERWLRDHELISIAQDYS